MAQPTTRTTQQTQAQPATNKGQVAVLAPPRLLPPDHGTLQEYGVDTSGWRTLVESIFPAAKTPMAVMMALDYCKRRKLDVFKHPVHIVPIWNSSAGENGKGAMVETIWPGINELRTTAIRTGQFAGMDVPTFGPMIENRFEGRIKKWVNGSASWEKVEAHVVFPEWCQITVYRTLGGNRVPFPGPKVYWLETYARIRNDCDVPNSMWEKRANGQLEKCAEAAALRRAFPEEIGSDYSIDEIGAFTTHAPADVTEQGSATMAPAAEPQRSDPKYQTQPDAPPSQGAPAESGQPATSPPAGAGSVSPPEAASRPAETKAAPKKEAPPVHATQETPGVTDVVDENAQPIEGGIAPEDPATWPPEMARPGEKLEFKRYGTVYDFCMFADPFLQATNAEGAAQFETYYHGMLEAMERPASKPKSKEAAKEYRATLAAFRASGREPGEEG